MADRVGAKFAPSFRHLGCLTPAGAPTDFQGVSAAPANLESRAQPTKNPGGLAGDTGVSNGSARQSEQAENYLTQEALS